MVRLVVEGLDDGGGRMIDCKSAVAEAGADRLERHSNVQVIERHGVGQMCYFELALKILKEIYFPPIGN
jgi:hypothetical protein